MPFNHLPAAIRESLRPRREKVFREKPGIPLDRNAKARIFAYAKGYNAKHRREGQHQGPITWAFFRVLRALLWEFHNSKTGYCFPSYESIAEKADCCRDTVYEAIKVLEDSGILDWVHRFDKIFVKGGWQVIRVSNAYLFVEEIRDDVSLFGFRHRLIQGVAHLLAELRIDPDMRHDRRSHHDLAVGIFLAVLDPLASPEFGHSGLDLLALFFFFGDELFNCLAGLRHRRPLARLSSTALVVLHTPVCWSEIQVFREETSARVKGATDCNAEGTEAYLLHTPVCGTPHPGMSSRSETEEPQRYAGADPAGGSPGGLN